MAYEVSDGEGTLLSLVERAQPVTVYEVSKIYLASPVTNYGTSKGKLYPMVRRLKSHGLIEGIPIADDQRGTEHLRCTETGLAALRQWVGAVEPGHALPDDPLRTRIQSLHLLTRAEQLDWLDRARDAVAAKVREVEAYVEQVDMPRAAIALDHVRSVSQARLRWIERTARVLEQAQGENGDAAETETGPTG